MEMMQKLFQVFIVLIFFSSCEKATKEEETAINDLNNKFNDLRFSPGEGLVGTHLKVKMEKLTWDSLELKNLYDSSIGQYKDRNGVSWIYLSVHDKSDNYMFTIVKDEAKSSHIFFKE